MGAAKQVNHPTNTPIDTLTMLMLRYRAPVVPLETVVQDYLPHLTNVVAVKRAAKCELPFPAFKPDGNKSAYMVNVAHVALWLDTTAQECQKDWEAMQK